VMTSEIANNVEITNSPMFILFLFPVYFVNRLCFFVTVMV
jgi:hypothetical protein